MNLRLKAVLLVGGVTESIHPSNFSFGRWVAQRKSIEILERIIDIDRSSDHDLEIADAPVGDEQQIGPDVPNVGSFLRIVGSNVVGATEVAGLRIAAEPLIVPLPNAVFPMAPQRPIDGLGGFRMNDWAVIALQLIENELPVGVNVETIAPRKNHSLKVLNDLVNLRLKAVDLAGQRFGACVEIDEYQEPAERWLASFSDWTH